MSSSLAAFDVLSNTRNEPFKVDFDDGLFEWADSVKRDQIEDEQYNRRRRDSRARAFSRGRIISVKSFAMMTGTQKRCSQCLSTEELNLKNASQSCDNFFAPTSRRDSCDHDVLTMMGTTHI